MQMAHRSITTSANVSITVLYVSTIRRKKEKKHLIISQQPDECLPVSEELNLTLLMRETL